MAFPFLPLFLWTPHLDTSRLLPHKFQRGPPRPRPALQRPVERGGGRVVPAHEDPRRQPRPAERRDVPPPPHGCGRRPAQLRRLGVRHVVPSQEGPVGTDFGGVLREPRAKLGADLRVQCRLPAGVGRQRRLEEGDAAQRPPRGRVRGTDGGGETDVVDGRRFRAPSVPVQDQDRFGHGQRGGVEAVVQAAHPPLRLLRGVVVVVKQPRGHGSFGCHDGAARAQRHVGSLHVHLHAVGGGAQSRDGRVSP
mmetsp:Transcript_41276/g.80777  ORF Transcript_41276/g.80777 Transcript_41276/m.80777 type:complete len:250 (+) Transcript_41276:142-891(+)